MCEGVIRDEEPSVSSSLEVLQALPKEGMGIMRSLAVATCLILGVSLLGAAVPVAKVQPMSPGAFWVWIQNTATCPFDTFKLVFAPQAVTVRALTINGPQVAEIKNVSGVVTVKLSAGLKPGGWLIVGVTGAPTTYTAETLLKYKEAFTVPPFCR